MNILEGIKIKGEGVRIPNSNRRDLPRFFKDKGYKVGVEIGVQRASFLCRFCRTGLKMFGIDPWLGYDEYKRGQEKQDRIYTDAQKNTKMFDDCTLIRKKSMDAVVDFEDESIDFVYIDGHHGFKFVTEDIYEWSKKVKKGGVISGHDYSYTKERKNNFDFHAKYVVDAYTKAFNIKDWWVLGNDEKEFEGEKRDRCRSWFWFK